jgi:hypothetical protein
MFDRRRAPSREQGTQEVALADEDHRHAVAAGRSRRTPVHWNCLDFPAVEA